MTSKNNLMSSSTIGGKVGGTEEFIASADFTTVADLAKSNALRDQQVLNYLKEEPLLFVIQALEINLAHIFATRNPELGLTQSQLFCFFSDFFITNNNTTVVTKIDIGKTLTELPVSDNLRECTAGCLEEFLKLIDFMAKREKLEHIIEVDAAKNTLTFHTQRAFFEVVNVLTKATPGLYDIDNFEKAEDIYKQALNEPDVMAALTGYEQEMSYKTGFISVGLLLDGQHITKQQFKSREINRAFGNTLPYPMNDLEYLMEKYRFSLQKEPNQAMVHIPN